MDVDERIPSPRGMDEEPRGRSRSPSPERRRSRSPSPSPPRKSSRSPSRSPRRRSRSPSRSPRRSSRSPRRSNGGRREQPATMPPSKILGLFGLSPITREEDLRNELGRYGKVEKVVLITDRRTGQSKGYAFVYFELQEEATKAKEACADFTLHGRSIRVDFSETKRAHSPTPGRYMGRPSQMRPRNGGGRSSSYRYEPYRRSPPRDRDYYRDRDYDRRDGRDRYDDRDRRDRDYDRRDRDRDYDRRDRDRDRDYDRRDRDRDRDYDDRRR